MGKQTRERGIGEGAAGGHGVVGGGNAESSGAGGQIVLQFTASSFQTKGSRTIAILGVSQGGNGHQGGADGGGSPGHGGVGKGGGDIEITPLGENTLEAQGSDSDGIAATGMTNKGNRSLTVAVGGSGSSGSRSYGTQVIQKEGTITTHGHTAHGILAQSVVGGGIKGDVAATTGGALIGSGGVVGVGGDVSVRVLSGIHTTGDNAHAVFAQSASGKAGTNSNREAGDVIVEISGNAVVSAEGVDTNGSLAQAVGENKSTTSRFSVKIDEGATMLGSSTGAAAVSVDATTANPDSQVVENYGTLTGNLDIAGLTGQVLNSSSAVFNAGTSLSLAAEKSGVDDTLLRNLGIISPGGTNNIISSRLSNPLSVTGVAANFVQAASGQLSLDVLAVQSNGADSGNDLLAVGGTADLSGKVAITFDVGADAAFGPRTTEPLLSVDAKASAATQSNLTVVPSVVAEISFGYPNSNDIVLIYEIDCASEDVLAVTQGNQGSLTSHLQDAHEARALECEVANALIATSDPDAYRDATNSMSSEVSVDTQISALQSSIRFGDALLSCAERSGTYRYFNSGQCSWMIFGGTNYNLRESSDNLGFDESGWQVAAGGQLDLDNNWLIGGGLSYENRTLDVSGTPTSSDIEQYQFGLSAKYLWNNAEFEGALTAGWGTADITRNPYAGSTAKGAQDFRTFGGRFAWRNSSIRAAGS